MTERVLGHWFLLLVVFLSVGQASHAATPLEGKRSEWRGYSRTDFELNGRQCFAVQPNKTAPGRPWVWRARFPGYHAEIDEILLGEGYHIAHIDTGGMLGSPEALKHWEAFYQFTGIP